MFYLRSTMLTQKQYMHNEFIHASIIVKKSYNDKLNVGLLVTMTNKQQEKQYTVMINN